LSGALPWWSATMSVCPASPPLNETRDENATRFELARNELTHGASVTK
jgi:hypothetical protein